MGVFGGHRVNKNVSSSVVNIRRPVASIVYYLLCGNAGVGKTTLAHIAAKHAGYRPTMDRCAAAHEWLSSADTNSH